MESHTPYPTINFDSPEVEGLRLGNLVLTLTGRAWSLLRGYTTEDVNNMLLKVSAVFGKWEYGFASAAAVPSGINGEINFEPKSSVHMTFSGQPGEIKLALYTMVVELFYRQDDMDIPRRISEAEVDWPAYFSAIALGYMNAAGKQRVKAIASTSLDDKHDAFESFAVLTALAAEAVAYADRAAGDDGAIAAGIKQAIAERNAKAGKQRHAKVEQVKQEFIQFFQTNKYVSRAEAARRFFDGLPEDKKRLFSKSNVQRTLVSALKGL